MKKQKKKVEEVVFSTKKTIITGVFIFLITFTIKEYLQELAGYLIPLIRTIVNETYDWIVKKGRKRNDKYDTH
jgi:hypothetical protein